MKISTITLFLSLLAITTFGQDTLRIKLHPGTGENANLSYPDSTANFGNVDELKADAWTCSGNNCEGRALFYFDISGMAGFTIYHAALDLHANTSTSNGGGTPMNGSNSSTLQRVTSSWNAATVNWATQPTTTTVNEVAFATSTSGTQDYTGIDVTNLVIDLLGSADPNSGFMLKLDSEIKYTSMIFASGTHSDSTLWPELELIYDSAYCQSLSISVDGSDANISFPDTTLNYASTTEIKADVWTCSGQPCIGRALFRFDLASIPYSHVVSAYLDLYSNPSPINGGGVAMNGNNEAHLMRTTSAWNESTVTWATQPGVSSQNEIILPVSSSPGQDYLHLDVTNMVQDMFNDPNHGYGFMLMLSDESTLYRSMIFASGDYPDSAVHPVLHLCVDNALGLEEHLSTAENISVGPNPFSDNLILHFQKNNPEERFVTMTDYLGRTIFSTKTNSNQEELKIPNSVIESLANGIYFISVRSKNNSDSSSIKVVKQK